MARSKYLQPKKYFHYLVRKIKGIFSGLENKGERVEIFFKSKFFLDDNEKCHLERYSFVSSLVGPNDAVADLACGTGYGSVMLASKAASVVGVDIDASVIRSIKTKYAPIKNLSFLESDLLDINFDDQFDYIVSFETIEHFAEADILKLLGLFNKALKQGGKLIISTPYMQKDDERAIEMGFHKTFFIDEAKITKWMSDNGFKVSEFYYQSYDYQVVSASVKQKDFVICVAEKI
jgi:2-polyprenyl-3-methyl-5-hydroxy-6-metoxy-1,4-benzoquinol methylase